MGGRVVHFEIPFDDGERAKEFYTRAFGWTLMGMPEMDYLLAITGPTPEQGPPTEPGFINGGLIARPESLSGSPVVVVDVEDIDAALATVESLGGSTLQGKGAVADMGFTAYVKDTEGNVVGLWQTATG